MSNNIEVLSAVHGIAPRSEELLRLGGDVERGRSKQADYDELIAEQTGDWLELQTRAGIDIVENGKLHWQDHLRPIVKASQGFAPDIDNAPVTRWFGDNRFYRQPTITGKLRLDYDRADEELGSLGENISLLAPRSFAYLCRDDYPELPAERNVQMLYSDLFFVLERQGVKRVLLEDYLPDDLLPTGSLSDTKLLASWCQDLQISLISPDKQSAIPYDLGSKFGVSVEAPALRQISAQPDYRRPNFNGSELWHQVIDASSTATDELSVSTFPSELFRSLAPARLVLTHNVDLESLPLTYAKGKVKHLGEFAAQLRQVLETEV